MNTIIITNQDNHQHLAALTYAGLQADGTARACVSRFTSSSFCQWTRPGDCWFFMGHDAPAGQQPTAANVLGYLALRDWEGKTARIHFAITRRARSFGVALALRAFNIAFSTAPGFPGLQSIFGIFPQSYRHIPPFARKLGGACLGTIPGAGFDQLRNRECPGVIWCFTPETLQQQQTKEM